MDIIKIYADESSQNAHRHLAMGACVAGRADAERIFQAFTAGRSRHGLLGGELKWAKVSKAKLGCYIAMCDILFDLIERDVVHFHALTLDTSTIDHKTHSEGNAEIGFNKLIYQLLLHKFGRRYGAASNIQVHLDNRTHNENPNAMTDMLNAALARDWNILSKPFQSVQFANSKDHDLLQFADILIGAIAYRRNRFDLKPEAAPHKIALMKHIAGRIRRIEAKGRLSPRPKKFTVWDFRYSK